MTCSVPKSHVEFLPVHCQIVGIIVEDSRDVLRGEPPGRVRDEHARLAHHAVAHGRDLDGPDPAGHAGLVRQAVAALGAALLAGAARLAAPAAAAHLGPEGLYELQVEGECPRSARSLRS